MLRLVTLLSLSLSVFAATAPETIVLPNEPKDYFEILGKGNSACMRSGYVTLQPGESVGTHNTGNFEELVITLEGQGEMEMADRGRTPFAKGILLHAFPHSEHNVWNTGKEVLRYIYIVADTGRGKPQ